MYCVACGNEIHDDAVVCMNCGVGTSKMVKPTSSESELSFLWGVLGFFVPIVGIILYIVWKNTKPMSSKASGIGALIRIIILTVIYSILLIIIMFSEM